MLHSALVLLMLSGPAVARYMGTLHGTVRAEGTQEPIAYATLELPGLGRRVEADARGYYVVPDLPIGRWQVRVSAFGYRPSERMVDVGRGESLRVDFVLARRPIELEGVAVETESAAPAVAEHAGPGPVRISAPMIRVVPALAEADVLRAVQALPSVAAASDFSSALYVRGGSPDQNLVLLDGAPLFNPYHLGGIFSAFDPDAVQAVDVLPGAFPASVGDRVSGVVAVRTRDGGRDRIRGRGAVGLISSRIGLDGPLPGGNGSFLLSTRRTYLDLFTDAAFALGLIGGTLPYAFTDAHLKLTHDVGALGSVSASFYFDGEGIGLPDEMKDEPGDVFEFGWSTRMALLRYRQPLGSALLGEVRFAASSFDGSFDALEQVHSDQVDGEPTGSPALDRRVAADVTVRDVVAGADLTWYRRSHRVRAGVQFDAYLFDHDVVLDPDEFDGYIPPFQRTDRPRTLAVYLEDQWSPVDALRLRLGLRLLHAGEHGTAWMPRLGARFALSPALALTLGAGRYAQVLHSLRDEESVAASFLAYDLLAAVPPEMGLTTAEDAVLGLEWRSGRTSLRVDAYAKRMENLALPPPPAEPLNAPALVVDGFVPAQGTAYGMEVLARGPLGPADFSLAYTLAFAERDVAGEIFPPHFERRHMLDATARFELGDDGSLSTRLLLGSGQPYTAAVGLARPYRHDPLARTFTDEFANPIVLLGEHNAARLPGYFRIDVAARKSFEKHWFGTALTVTPYLQILNVLNTHNVLTAEATPYGRGGVLSFSPELPFLPTFGVEWRF